MTDPSVARGQIWWVDVGLQENKRFVVVSNNQRNRNLGDVLGVRLTTARKPDIPSIVEFQPGEITPTRCYAVADDIWLVRKGWLRDRAGALTPAQMERVGRALQVALDR